MDAGTADPWGLGLVAVVVLLALAYLVRLFVHPRGSGCPSCGKEKTCAMTRLTTNEDTKTPLKSPTRSSRPGERDIDKPGRIP